MTDWVLVPIEPTDAMISAGIAERHEQAVPEAWSLATSNIYRAMIAARPAVGEDVVERLAKRMAASQGLDWDGKARGTEYANHGYWLSLADAAIIAALEDPSV